MEQLLSEFFHGYNQNLCIGTLTPSKHLFIKALERYRLHRTHLSVPEFLETSICSVNGCSRVCVVLADDEPAMTFMRCELIFVIAQMLSVSAGAVASHPWFQFRMSVQKVVDIPEFVGDFLLRANSDDAFGTIFPSLRENVILTLAGHPAAASTRAHHTMAAQMLRVLSLSRLPIFTLFFHTPVSVPRDRPMESLILRLLVDFLCPEEHMQHASNLCADNECMAMSSISYHLLAAGQLPLIEGKPDMYFTLNCILRRYSPHSAVFLVGRCDDTIIRASDISWQEPGIIPRLHEFAGEIEDSTFQAAVKNLQPDDPHVVMLFHDAAALSPMNLRLDVDSYQVVPRKYAESQATGEALFRLVVKKPKERFCVYPTLACMFASEDIRKIKWCVSICHYMLRENVDEAISVQDLVQPEAVSLCTRVFQLILAREDLFILLRDDTDTDHTGLLLAAFLNLMLGSKGCHFTATNPKLPGLCWALVKLLDGDEVARDKTHTKWLLDMKSPMDHPSMVRICEIVEQALAKDVLTARKGASIVADLIPFKEWANHKRHRHKLIISEYRQRILLEQTSTRRSTIYTLKPDSALVTLFALFDFRDMGNISAGCAFQHIKQTIAMDVSENCCEVLDGMFDEHIFYASDIIQFLGSMANVSPTTLALIHTKPVPQKVLAELARRGENSHHIEMQAVRLGEMYRKINGVV